MPHPSKKPRRADPSPPESLLREIIDVSEQVLALCGEDLETHAQALNQLMLRRGELLEAANQRLRPEDASDEADFQALLWRVDALDQDLGRALQENLSHIQARLGTCKQSRQLVQHYRKTPDPTRQTRSHQA